jgi:hypothetical protein
MPGGLWPARSRAEVSFLAGEQGDVERIARRLFGGPLRRWQYAGLAGAPDGARVELGTYDGQLYLETSEPVANRYRMVHLARRTKAHLVILVEGFHVQVQNMQGRGLGLRIFHRQLANAQALGVDRIQAIAGRRHDENGYYTWPRFGFDGALPGKIRANLPLGLEDIRTVLDLMASEKGRRWWQQHGGTIRVTFDLADCSRSRKVFQRYLRQRLERGGLGNLT